MLVTEFTVGKTLAEDIITNQGMLLLKAGHKVTPSLVAYLKKNAVSFIYVK
jgi:hypothetical protein